MLRRSSVTLAHCPTADYGIRAMMAFVLVAGTRVSHCV